MAPPQSTKKTFAAQQENFFLLLGIAILIGAITGSLAVGFRYILLYATSLFWQRPVGADATSHLHWWMIMLVPAIGGLLVGPLVTFLAPETRGAGVPEVIKAVAIDEGKIKHRTTFFKIITTVLSISSGASVGREGPIVHIGSSVGSSIAQLIRLSGEWRRVLLACGAAAGIAATFNAPMAGMLFAVEIILVDFEIRYISHIAISSVTATVISHHFLGNLPTFTIPSYTLVSYWEIFLYFLLGILAGLTAIVFIKSISGMEQVFEYLPIPSFLQPVIGGVIVGLLAISFPLVLGVGYQSINLVLTAKMALQGMMLLMVVKLLATAVSLGAGFSGGIFAPSLVVGALLGGTYGSTAALLFPDLVAPFSAYGLVGMGAMVSGMTLAPITAIFTIFELTYNFEIILPLMTSCIASLIIVQTFYGTSIYEAKLRQKGVIIVRGHDVNILRSMLVADYMEHEFEQVRDNVPLNTLLQVAEASSFPHFVVLDHEQNLVGMLSMRDIKGCLADMGELQDLLVAADIMSRTIHSLTPTDTFETAFAVFEGKQISTMPVVAANDRRKVIGILKKSTLLLAYNQKILKISPS